MIDTILSTVLSAQLAFLKPSFHAQSSNPKVVFTRVLPEDNFVNYVAVKNQILPSMAQAYSGSKVYLTTPTPNNPTLVVTPIPPTPTAQPTVVPTAIPVTQAPAVVSTSASSISDAAITYLGSCEAGMDPAKNTGNGYYGAFQFSYGTWKRLNTGYERADLAPIEVQEAAVKQLLQGSSIYGQFPGCARKMRAAGLI